MSMRTNLASGAATFQMVEHVMSALYALEIDNCVVQTNAEEMPGLDGSSYAYVDALQSVGMVMQAAARKRFIVDRSIHVGTAESWVEVSPAVRGWPSFEYRLDYGMTSQIKAQSFTHQITPSNYLRDIAPARTFVTAEQVAHFRAANIGNHVTMNDLIVFDAAGSVIDNALRFSDECSRHKVLDLIGDLALAGVDLVGKVVSFRGGHQLNRLMAQSLAKFAECSTMSTGSGSQSAPPQTRRPMAA